MTNFIFELSNPFPFATRDISNLPKIPSSSSGPRGINEGIHTVISMPSSARMREA
jgi:hypothetical protein